MHFQPGEGPSRGLLRDCTAGCGTDGSFYSTKQEVHLGAVAPLGLLGLAQQADTAADQRLNLATNWEYGVLNHTV